MTINAKRKVGLFCPVPEGIEFRLGKADPDGLALPGDGTLLRSSVLLFLLIVIVFCQFDEYLELSIFETATIRSGFPFGESQSEGFHAMKT